MVGSFAYLYVFAFIVMEHSSPLKKHAGNEPANTSRNKKPKEGNFIGFKIFISHLIVDDRTTGL